MLNLIMVKVFENEFKVMIVELLQSGSKAKALSEEYGVSTSAIRRWRREYKANNNNFVKAAPISSEQAEIKKLRKELKDAQLERDILKKAVSIFSKSDK